MGQGSDFGREGYVKDRFFDKPNYAAGARVKVNQYLTAGVQAEDRRDEQSPWVVECKLRGQGCRLLTRVRHLRPLMKTKTRGKTSFRCQEIRLCQCPLAGTLSGMRTVEFICRRRGSAHARPPWVSETARSPHFLRTSFDWMTSAYRRWSNPRPASSSLIEWSAVAWSRLSRSPGRPSRHRKIDAHAPGGRRPFALAWPRSLYSGEESLEQVKDRAHRLGVRAAGLSLASETELTKIVEAVDKVSPAFCVIDSIQTIYRDDMTSAPGSVGQVRECTAELLRLAKSRGITVFVLGHVTKEGDLAGPRVLEHMVDTVLYFESEREQIFFTCYGHTRTALAPPMKWVSSG